MTRPPILLLRHSRAVVSDATPPRDWPLTAAGRRDAQTLGRRLASRPLGWDSVVCSGERKAIETASNVAALEPAIDDRLREVSKPWYRDADDHEADAIRYLRGALIGGWEPQDEAAARFDAAITTYSDRFAAIVTHGTIMSLWLATRLDDFDPVSFWLSLRFPDAHLLHPGDEADDWGIEQV